MGLHDPSWSGLTTSLQSGPLAQFEPSKVQIEIRPRTASLGKYKIFVYRTILGSCCLAAAHLRYSLPRPQFTTTPRRSIARGSYSH